jgi:hypothetical protein
MAEPVLSARGGSGREVSDAFSLCSSEVWLLGVSCDETVSIVAIRDTRRGGSAYHLAAVSGCGAAKASFPLRGELLTQWNWLVQHSGDEHSKDKTRDHESAKSLTLWMNQGFARTDPGACNTFVAASAKVS